ncbi:hypothetical protein [Microbacterium sp. NPDC055357]
MTDDERTNRGTVSLARKIIVGIIVVSFGAAAVGGIAVLLGGSLDEMGARVLGTTAVIGAFSVAVLCCVALAGRRLQAFGLIGAAVSVIAAALVVLLLWYEPASWDVSDNLWRVAGTGIAMTAAFALASLLLLLADRRQPAVRWGLIITLGFFAVVLGLTVYLIWWGETIDDDAYARVLGIFAILAALGAIVVPVISLLLRERPTAGSLSRQAVERLDAEAARRGISPDALVDELLAAPRA